MFSTQKHPLQAKVYTEPDVFRNRIFSNMFFSIKILFDKWL